MSTKVKIRCRRAQCNNYEEEKPFPKCSKCNIAKYCSSECQVQDWPLHKMMCSDDRVVLNADGTTEKLSDVLDAADRLLTETSSAPTSVPVYVSENEMSDQEVIKSTIERLQLQTNIFAVQQYNATKQKGLLFVQTENTLDDFRYLQGIKNEEKLDRSFVCYYVTVPEFISEIAPGHPHPEFKKPSFQANIKKYVTDAYPDEHITTLAVFGCGYVSLMQLDIHNYEDILTIIKTDSVLSENDDCLELYIDRD